MAGFSFGATYLAYHFHRAYPFLKNYRISFPKSHALNLGIGLVLSAYFFAEIFSIPILIVLLPTAGLSLLYVVPASFGRTKRAQAMREREGWKLWVIALCWALLTVALPLVGGKSAMISGTEAAFLFLERLFFVAGLTISFDIRDLYLDSPELRTLPQRVGAAGSVKLAVFLIAIASVCSTVLWVSGLYSNWVFAALLMSALLSSLLIIPSPQKKDKLYFTGILDSMLILQPALVFSALMIS